MAERKNYRQAAMRAEKKIHKSAEVICKKIARLRQSAIAASATEPTTCEQAESLVAKWEAAANDANDLLMASMNTATEVLAGLQAAYAVRASVCETA